VSWISINLMGVCVCVYIHMTAHGHQKHRGSEIRLSSSSKSLEFLEPQFPSSPWQSCQEDYNKVMTHKVPARCIAGGCLCCSSPLPLCHSLPSLSKSFCAPTPPHPEAFPDTLDWWLPPNPWPPGALTADSTDPPHSADVFSPERPGFPRPLSLCRWL
jgi:hypothetical protein